MADWQNIRVKLSPGPVFAKCIGIRAKLTSPEQEFKSPYQRVGQTQGDLTGLIFLFIEIAFTKTMSFSRVLGEYISIIRQPAGARWGMLVSSQEMLGRAVQGKYAVGQFNINNLEWFRAVISAAQALQAPVILGVTESACAYMGGLRTVRAMAEGMLASLGAKVPVALHLDHAHYEMCLMAIGAGFTSVMFDGSKMPFAENLRLCRTLAKICRENGVALEAELGSPAGEEDGISGSGERADPAQCAELAQAGLTALAASIGNIHGEYPDDWQGLDMALLAKVESAVRGLPLVLHGGSGIPEAMVKTAIRNGIAKINVNTECQIAFAQALREYFDAANDRAPKGYTLQKLLRPGLEAIEEVVRNKIIFFGAADKCR